MNVMVAGMASHVLMRHDETGAEHQFRAVLAPLQANRGWTIVQDDEPADVVPVTPAKSISTDQENFYNG